MLLKVKNESISSQPINEFLASCADHSNQIGEFDIQDGCQSEIHKSLTTDLQIHGLGQGNNTHIPSAGIFSITTIIDAEDDLWFSALRAILVKCFEWNGLNQGIGVPLDLKAAHLDDFGCDRILPSQSFPLGKRSADQQSSETDTLLYENNEDILPMAAARDSPNREKQGNS
jgi:hypothetical protein